MAQPRESASTKAFGHFVFCPVTGKLTKQGAAIRLTGMPLKVLARLLDRPGELVSRKELKSLLWVETSYGDFEKGLNSVINLLRNALNDSADQPRYIETVPGQGYRFIALVRFGEELNIGNRQSTGSAPTAIVNENEPETSPEDTVAPARKRPNVFVILGALLALLISVVWISRALQPVPKTLLDGTRASANREANDQFNLAFHLIDAEGDIPRARQASERAISLNPHFAAAHVQHALLSIIELWTGYSNDLKVVRLAEKEIHEAENKVPETEGLLLAAKTAVYLAEGRLDRVPAAKLNDFTRNGADPTWLAILRLLAGETDEAIKLLRYLIERDPLRNPARMFLGELLRTKGDTKEAISLLERTLEQSPRNTTATAFLTLAYLDAGSIDKAEALLLSMRREFEKNYLWRCSFAILLAAEGKHGQAAEVMDQETLKFARLSWPQWSSTAEFYGLQGDRDKAMEWLEFATEHGDERAFYFRHDSRLVCLRSDPRFQLLLENIEFRQAAFR